MEFDPSKIKVLYSQQKLDEIVGKVAKEIEDYYKPITEEITAICVLKGSIHFYSDLLKKINLNIRYNFVHVSSYSGEESTGKIKVKTWVDESLFNQHVLVIEDIVDTGTTLRFIMNYILKQKPKDLKLATLFDKKAFDHKVEVDFAGDELGDHFVVGYGLDYNQLYRNLPYVGYLDNE